MLEVLQAVYNIVIGEDYFNRKYFIIEQVEEISPHLLSDLEHSHVLIGQNVIYEHQLVFLDLHFVEYRHQAVFYVDVFLLLQLEVDVVDQTAADAREC